MRWARTTGGGVDVAPPTGATTGWLAVVEGELAEETTVVEAVEVDGVELGDTGGRELMMTFVVEVVIGVVGVVLPVPVGETGVVVSVPVAVLVPVAVPVAVLVPVAVPVAVAVLVLVAVPVVVAVSVPVLVAAPEEVPVPVVGVPVGCG